MSKINTVRIINLNYNHNTMKIDDETFYMQGESTLLALRNGGGKSVLVQMLMAPFMSKGKRNLKDRQFQSYFTTNRPTFILVEWLRDHQSGYVLTGMMVRKRQDSGEEVEGEPLEVIQFIHEYEQPNAYDIQHFPAIEITDKGKKLKGFNNMRQLFESLKKEGKYQFNYYDMSQSHQAKRYFNQLKENQIYQKEWESIIKTINLKESGLSELFNDAKNAAGLVDRWFLRIINDKLNKEDDKIKRFQDNVMKYIHQYKSNVSKITRKEMIEKFKEEAQTLLTAAQAFKAVSDEKEALKEQLVGLTRQLKEEIAKLSQNIIEATHDKETLELTISTLKYEALCIEIYKLLSEKEELTQQFQQHEIAVKQYEAEKEKLQKAICIGECAKLYGIYKEDSQKVQRYEIELHHLYQKSEDLTPRRNDLGYTLKQYYKKEVEKTSKNIQKIENQQKENEADKRHLEEKAQQNRINSNQLQLQRGRCEAKIDRYDQVEKQYNQKYNAQFNRNIVGYYDQDFLYRQTEALNDKEENLTKQGIHLKNKWHETLEQEKNIVAKERETREALIQIEGERKEQEKTMQLLEEALQKRKQLLKYIHLNETELFHEERIISTFNQQIKELMDKKAEIELQYAKEKESYDALKSGKVLKLSKAVEQAIKTLGVHLVYGMEWLNKNGHTQDENIKLVQNNPFIPYALIMSQKEMALIRQSKLPVFTETPIPIIRREDLEKTIATNAQLQLFEFDYVHFLVAFNEGLLSEQSLQEMIKVKENKLEDLKNLLSEKQEEINFYETKKNEVVYSPLTKDYYETTQKALQILMIDEKTKQTACDTYHNQLNDLKQVQQELNDALQKFNQDMVDMKAQKEAFKMLTQAYALYKDEKETLLSIKKQLEMIEKQIAVESDQREHLYQEGEDLNKAKLKEEQYHRELKEKCVHYESYQTGLLISKDIEDVEAEYKSLTESLSLDEKRLQELLEQARKDFSQHEEELLEKAKEYQLEEETFKNVSYSKFEEKEKKEKIKTIEGLLKELQQQFGSLKEENGKLVNQLESMQRKLEQTFHQGLKPKEALKVCDFQKAIITHENELKQLQKQIEKLKSEKQHYEGERASLSEFEELTVSNTLKITFDPTTIEKIKKEMIRDFRLKMRECGEKKDELIYAIHQMQQKEAFQDEFFKQPLTTLEKIGGQPEFVIENLKNTLIAYESLMIKLAADIALIEKEKQSVLDGLMQYISEVHEHIGKIDRNATVTIHDKPIKMLKIELPDWKEQEGIYALRLNDLLESITQEAIEKLERNENIEEIISKRVTTRNLYNDVVGINQVGVKLYKIEEERVYQISWDEVAKNSGGEGFLSAFVVLTSLLSYMRRDESDLWGEYESGKVLVMDNPFAQTNAAHLLKPLMDMAQKRNTQLICLSGLNGESIYNRFDNIYVLNLVTSRLNTGTQYLTSEHLRGPENLNPQELVSVQIKTEVMDQMTLF